MRRENKCKTHLSKDANGNRIAVTTFADHPDRMDMMLVTSPHPRDYTKKVGKERNKK